jgi:MFS family permease
LIYQFRHAINAAAGWDKRYELLVSPPPQNDQPFLTLHSLPLVLQNSVGLSNNLSRLLSAVNSVSYLAFSFCGLLLIEKAGRRKLMMWGAAGQFVCYVLICGLLSQTNDTENGSTFGVGATVFFFLYYVFFGICWQVRTL